MSAHNAAYSLPPGDRDFHPEQGRSPARATDRAEPDLFDELEQLQQPIARIDATVAAAQEAMGALKCALALKDLPAIRKAAWALSEALMIDLPGQAAQIRKAAGAGRRPKTKEH